MWSSSSVVVGAGVFFVCILYLGCVVRGIRDYSGGW